MYRLCSRAPTDCVQWFTGISGNVYSYNFAGSQLLNAQSYNNCIRTEEGEAKDNQPAFKWAQACTPRLGKFNFDG